MQVEVRMPRLSETVAEGTVVSWLKRVGDRVERGEPLVMVEVDKSSVEVAAETSGVLAEIVAAEGRVVDVGAVLALVVPVGEPAGPATSAPMPDPGSPAPVRSGVDGLRRRLASPAARRLARELEVDLDAVTGSGSDGLVTEKDVRAAAAQQPAAPRPNSSIPYTGVRRTIGERMSLSRRTAADVTTVAEVDMTRVAELRKELGGISYTAFVARATAEALKEFPVMNSSLQGDEIVLKGEVNLGVAVAIADALVVPVVKSAGSLSLAEIAREVERLSTKARESGLAPEDSSGSTFTVTNSGAFGSLMFTPIINYPEAAILGMGKVMEAAVVREGQIVVRLMMYLCLSYDHRIVDGAVAVRFLQRIKQLLEAPDSLLSTV